MFIPVWTLVLMGIAAVITVFASFYLGFGFMACLVLAGRCNEAERRRE